jgi:hypothetical protein
MKLSTFLGCLVVSVELSAQCISTGPLSGSAFNTDNSGSYSFSNPQNVGLSDNNRTSASAIITLLSGNTDALLVSDFQFSIPATASICGIKVEIEKNASISTLLATVSDHRVRLIKAGNAIGNNKAMAGAWSSAETYETYGGNSDLWGTTWSPADINDPGFGLSFSATISGIIGLLPSARVNHVQITVYYASIVLSQTLQSFHADYDQNENILLSWANSDFSICKLERSLDSQNWSTIYAGEGNHFTDINGNARVNTTYFYRLYIAHRYSKVLQVVYKPRPSFFIYPNPATDFIFIAAPIGHRSFATVTDFGGRTFQLPIQRVNTDLYKMLIAGLPNGRYIWRNGGEQRTFLKL